MVVKNASLILQSKSEFPAQKKLKSTSQTVVSIIKGNVSVTSTVLVRSPGVK